MNFTNRDFSLRMVLAAILLISLPLAYADIGYIEARRLQESGEILSLQEILKKVQPSFPGKILEIELEKKGRSIIYEIEILGLDGIVREAYVDAKTGLTLSIEDED